MAWTASKGFASTASDLFSGMVKLVLGLKKNTYTSVEKIKFSMSEFFLRSHIEFLSVNESQ